MAPPGFSFFSKSSSKASSSKSGTNVTVTTRVVQRSVAGSSSSSGAQAVSRQATSQVSKPSLPSFVRKDVVKKRKDAANTDAAPPPAKKPRLSSSPLPSRAPSVTPSLRASAVSSRHSSLAPVAEDASSRSVSVIPDTVAKPPRECWSREDGRVPELLSCERVIRDKVKTYKAYFRNPSDPSDTTFDPETLPWTELEYPNDHACERFLLLVPKDKDLYDPIRCLQQTLHTIVEHYLTPEQQALFGHLPDVALRNLSDDIERNDSPAPSRSSSSPAASPPTTASSPSSASDSSASSSVSTSTSATSVHSMQSFASLSALKDFIPPPSDDSPSFGFPRRLQRAIATRNGPLFLKTMDAINALLRSWKYPPVSDDPFDPPAPNALREFVKTWPCSGIPDPVRLRIIDETYQRAVWPHIAKLKQYESFSSEVYGELLPPFVSEIIRLTGLHSESLLVDLGSGVGNVVLQASLETGCKGYGIEINPGPAQIAKSQMEQFKMRCRMWGVGMGDVDLEEGDMLESPRVAAMLAKADVVLVNNKVFTQDLNEAIKAKFLDLKEGAIVVSLAPFVQSNRLSERNIDDISSILRVEERAYRRGYVSWGDGSGPYWLHRVDRAGYASARMNHENSRASSARPRRSRR
ncbi:Nucleosomal histone H3-Lys79 methylase [Steccherinum ochraceum]|uniref:Histone-lysine N-methyltransferase, H3 lysine-79 specific n=1 Tax=Steccherinum ochraceum TaxID=92696 RepID=A0A4R0RN55_9APHY|nr:Nucleosomal histone H3-Lys79 methylase [Steccherinum ochraceum]